MLLSRRWFFWLWWWAVQVTLGCNPNNLPLSISAAALEDEEMLLSKFAGAMKGSMNKAAALFQAPLSKSVRTVEALRAKQDEAA